MKISLCPWLLIIVSVSFATGWLPSTVLAQTVAQQITDIGGGNDIVSPNSEMTHEEALRYVVKIFNQWARNQNHIGGGYYQTTPAPMFGMPMSQPSAKPGPDVQMSAVGFLNLVECIKAIEMQQSSSSSQGQSYTLLCQMINDAIKIAFRNALYGRPGLDQSSFVRTIEENPTYFSLFSQMDMGLGMGMRRMQSSQALAQIIKDKLNPPTSPSNPSSATPAAPASTPSDPPKSDEASAFSKTLNGDSDNKKKQPDKVPVKKVAPEEVWNSLDYQKKLLDLAFANPDPLFQPVLNQYIQNLIQSSDPDSQMLSSALQSCLKDRSGAYDSTFPALLSAYNVQREKVKDDSKFANFSVIGFLSSHPKLCLDGDMFKAAQDKLDHDEKLSGHDEAANTCLLALFGNADSLQKVNALFLAGLNSSESSNNSRPGVPGMSGIQSDKQQAGIVLGSVAYNGAGGKVQGILDNINSATFDSTLGQWVITAPANYTNNSTERFFFQYKPSNNAGAQAPNNSAPVAH